MDRQEQWRKVKGVELLLQYGKFLSAPSIKDGALVCNRTRAVHTCFFALS